MSGADALIVWGGWEGEWVAGTVMPVAWTGRWGDGRVVCSSLGHAPADLEVFEAGELLRRGMLWAAR